MNHNTRVYENVFELFPSEENSPPLVRLNKLNTSEGRRSGRTARLGRFAALKEILDSIANNKQASGRQRIAIHQ